MLVKFKSIASSYGLGYVENEVVELDAQKQFKVNHMVTLVDQKNNPVGQKWSNREYSLQDLLERGVCVAAERESKAYREAKAEFDAEIKKDTPEAKAKEKRGFVFVAK
mgnify:CR=1 FL=1